MAALATNAPAPGPAGTPIPSTNTGVEFAIPAGTPGGRIEQEYQQLLHLDNEMMREIDDLILAADARGPEADREELQRQINERISRVMTAYDAFLERHPDHVDGRIAYGSFLNDTGQETEARLQWERALRLDPKNPAIYNNLAGIYGHRGPVTNAFVYYEKAIELEPNEPVYYHNFGTTVFLFRKDVMEHYRLDDEQKVFDKALELYEKAFRLSPTNFLLAQDIAQTYYGIRPPRHDAALAAWRRAYELASDDLERQGVRIHFARILTQAGRFDEARRELELVTDPRHADLKRRIQRTMERLEKGTNAPPAVLGEAAPPGR